MSTHRTMHAATRQGLQLSLAFYVLICAHAYGFMQWPALLSAFALAPLLAGAVTLAFSVVRDRALPLPVAYAEVTFPRAVSIAWVLFPAAIVVPVIAIAQVQHSYDGLRWVGVVLAIHISTQIAVLLHDRRRRKD